MKKIIKSLGFIALLSIANIGQSQNIFPSSGNVGIGTTSPQFLLDVVGRARFRTGAGQSAGLWFMNSTNTSNRVFLGMVNDTYTGIWGAGGAGWGIVLNVVNGSVGIGTTAPSSTYRLSVNGSVRAKEVVVETGWADYVFDSDYKLKSISEIENFIKANNHLPDVPSAAEVEKNGVKIGEMQSVLLRKIEELTLHMIQQNKSIENQKMEIEKLKAENEILLKKFTN